MGSGHHGLYDNLELWETENRAGIIVTLPDKKGSLAKVLALMDKHDMDLSQIHSKPPKTTADGFRTMNIHIDFKGTYND